MDESKVNTKGVGNRRGPLRTSGVWADDDGIFIVWNILLDIALEERFTIEVIDGNVKESLHCTSPSSQHAEAKRVCPG